mgnify:CR=1 FL=1
MRAPPSTTSVWPTTPLAAASDRLGMSALRELQSYAETPHGFEIQSVTDGGNAVLGWGQFFPATGTQIVLRRWNSGR